MHKQETIISRSELFPKVSANIQYILFNKAPSFVIERDAFTAGLPPSTVELPAGKSDIYTFTLGIKQPIFTGGYLVHNFENARIQEKVSERKAKIVKNEITMKVKLAYYELLKALKAKEVQWQIIKEKEEYKGVIEERLKEGVSNKEELLLIDSELAGERFELLKKENDISLKKENLKNLIGLSPDAEINPADKLESKKLLLGLEESKDIALKNKEDIMVFDYMMKSAGQEIEIAKSSFYPRVSVSGSYTRQTETPLSKPDLWALMVTLDWDIFAWGKTKADVKRARLKQERLNTEFDSLKREIAIDVEEKWFKVKEAEERVNMIKYELIHAKEHYKNAELRHKEGLINTAKFLEAETYLANSENKYINSLYDLNIALAEFEFSVSSDISPFVITESVQIQYGVEAPKVDVSSGETPDLLVGQPSRLSSEVSSGELNKKEHNLKIGNSYLIQVGAFKNADLANRLLERLKTDYPNSYIVVEGNFNKIRIPGIKTISEGNIIMKKLGERFKLKPFLIKDKPS